jgi:hypothetical protein
MANGARACVSSKICKMVMEVLQVLVKGIPCKVLECSDVDEELHRLVRLVP